MGGGDLNSKKSWHPNTMKNQERVWKAEQAAAEEKKRMVELQRERAAERDRDELNNLAKQSSDSSTSADRLHWMYNKPDKKGQQEEYLLGRAIEKNYDQPEKDVDPIPAVARRVVGSSMLTATGDAQVDLARKIREDPLLLVKERERAARAALLNNPLHRRRLTELLRKEQEQKEDKRKPKKKEKNLDNMLAAKLNALGGDKGIDLAALLGSDDTSSDSSSEKEKPKHKKKKKHSKSKKSKKTKRKKKSASCTESDTDNDESTKSTRKEKKYNDQNKSESRKRKSDSYDSDIRRKRDKREEVPETSRRQSQSKKSHRYDSSDEDRRKQIRTEPYKKQYSEATWRRPKSSGLNEKEKAEKLAAMAAAGAEREVQRGQRVAEQRKADMAAERAGPRPRTSGGHSDARALPDSLESRIHSNRHYIQRDRRHMNEHFARR